MKMLKNIINKYFNLENVALLLIAFSSFFMGGENLYIKYFIVVFLFFIFLLNRR